MSRGSEVSTVIQAKEEQTSEDAKTRERAPTLSVRKEQFGETTGYGEMMDRLFFLQLNAA
jgi:hypothetical protein